MLNQNGKSGYPYIVPDLSGMSFNIPPLSMMLAMNLSYVVFIMLGHGPSIPNLVSIFIMKGFCTLSNAFSPSPEMVI